jgi:flavin reductase (DIM6/NTAB) family NADH-FMN oxidoreductase RutF
VQSRLADAPAALECKLPLVLPLQDLEGRLTGSTLLLGQVVGVHIAPVAAAGTIARCGYRGDYAEATSLFEILRPCWKISRKGARR